MFGSQTGYEHDVVFSPMGVSDAYILGGRNFT